MTNNDSAVNGNARQPRPQTDLQALDRLVGTWKVTGGTQGTVRYAWADGGFFLIQHVEMEHDGQPIRGIEMIGHEHRFDAEPSADIRTRFYSYVDGMTLDYVYEIEGDTLTIWGGEKGSPAYFRGKFGEHDRICEGAWVYPGGGGYQSTMTRID